MKQKRDESSECGPVLFAAANSGEGFVSFYDGVFDRDGIDRRYLIKGGPGTGKSSFLRQMAAYAEERGMRVERYPCSSDPDSLDGIVLDGAVALIDATAPHTVEPRWVGARDEIVNLGEFWDGERLAERYNDIVALSALKESGYRRAYRFLSAALAVGENNRELIFPALREEKMRGAVERQMREIPRGRGFRVIPGLVSSVGMKGAVRLDTYERRAKRLIVIDDYYRTGNAFLSCLIAEAQKKECELRVSYDPVDLSLPDAVFFEESGICFVLGEHGERMPDGRINMKRFVDAEGLKTVKVAYRVNLRILDALMGAATEALSEAGSYHQRLEEIYGACMDFDAQRRFFCSFCQKFDRG